MSKPKCDIFRPGNRFCYLTAIAAEEWKKIDKGATCKMHLTQVGFARGFCCGAALLW